jgi:diguanylate cyclase (GGDEF)-like protein/PAS domain S-box-containing protein
MANRQLKRDPSIARWIFGGLTAAICLILIVLWLSFTQSISERDERSILYARMIEGSVSRTFEALEIALSSLSEEVAEQPLTSERLLHIRTRALKTIKFAPHLRQIVVVQGTNVLVDTRTKIPLNLNMNTLGVTSSQSSNYSLGLIVGNTIKGRFLPYRYELPDETSQREIIPIAFPSSTTQGDPVLIIAGLNPGYVKRYIGDLNIESEDNVYLVDFSGNSLIQRGLFGPSREGVINLLNTVIASGADESISKPQGRIPLKSTVVRLLSKYPLAVSVVTDHRKSLNIWINQNQNLLLLLIFAVAALIIGASYLVKAGRKAFSLKEEIHLLSKVVEHTPTLIVITDPSGVIEYVNNSFEKATGYSKAEVIGHNPRMLKSGETSEQEYIEMWGVLTSGGTWSGEFHNKRKDGTLYWERASIWPLADDDGSLTHYIAIKQLVTEEKVAQEKLRLASTVFSSAAEAIMVTDDQNNIQMVNSSFTTITGYEEKEILGKNPAIFKSGKHSPDFYTNLYTSLESKGSWSGEIWNRRKNGETYPQWLTISSRLDQKGNIEGYVALFNDITQRKNDEAVIIHQANYDALTALPNRHLFQDRLSQAIAAADRSQEKVALLYIDLDRFKYVNDTFGHQSGDLLLCQVAERLKSTVRKSDTVARLGGDEFSIIISQIDLSTLALIEKVANKILTSLSKPYRLDGNEAFISCSIGISIYPDNGATLEELIINSDSAMYKAKELGRNAYEFFSDDLSEQHQKRLLLEKGLYKALQHSEFYLEYQPIWSVDGREIKSVEALIRWKHPEKGLVSPVEFIPLAEESSLIHEIGAWVVQEACKFARELSLAEANPPLVSINVSSMQFLKGDVGTLISQELTANGLAGNALVVEITESILLLEQGSILSQLEELVAMGVEIAVDDFGTGYSSLSYLKKYPIKRVKIDKSPL